MTSRTTVLAVVIGLVVITLTCVAGAIALLWADKAVPDSLWNLATFCAGAVAALLASTRGALGPKDTEPQSLAATVTPVVAEPIKWTAPEPSQTMGTNPAGA